LAERNKLRDPNRRKLFRAPSVEWIRTWDLDEFGGLPTSTQYAAAEAKRQSLVVGNRRGDGLGEASVPQAAGVSNTQWTELGPSNIGGRIRAVVIDPRDQNRIYIGAATGGVWLSENAGQSFRPLTDSLPSLAIGALAMDPNNPNILYAGTGENFAGFAGMGVFKSVNGGASWTFLNSTSTDTTVNSLGTEWGAINRIAISPFNSNLLLVATARTSSTRQGAIMRSVDGGNTWTRILLAAGSVTSGSNTNFGNASPPVPMDVRFDPNNANNVVAGTANGHMYYSRDAGQSWTQTGPLLTTLQGRSTSARAEIAFAKSTPDLVYISLDSSPDATGARGEVWKSNNGGETWTNLSAPKHLNEQGDYDNTIWVDPANENHVIVGGLDLYQSMDGGASFNKISDWRLGFPGQPQPHGDHHQIVSVPNFNSGNPIVYFGNDGGLYRANNVFAVGPSGTTAWQNLNNGLNITQFYGGAGLRAAGGRIIGGTQDNGALELSQGTTWSRTAGGDGGYAAVDPLNDSTIYGEYVYAAVHRKVGAGSREYICSGITEALQNESSATYCGATATEEANFIAPFILDPNNRERMLVGANSLWVTNNVRDPIPTWSAVLGPGGTKSQGLFINAIAVHAGDSNIIWVGRNGGQIWKTSNGLTPNPAWTQIQGSGLPASTITRITIDADNPNRVWVVYSGFLSARIWVTNNGGSTWSNIHNNLPNVTLLDMKRHPVNANWLYVAAANGVYTSENGGQTWSTTNDGPAGVRVRELFWYDSSTLVAATYGRGMFRTTVAGATPANSSYQGLWWNANESGWGMSVTQHGNMIFAALYTYDATGQPTWYVIPNCPVSSGRCTGEIYKVTGGTSPAVAWSAAGKSVTSVGTGTLTFSSTSTGTFNFTINNVTGAKAITLQPLATGTTPPAVDYTDLWWNPNEDGWGISLTQQFGIIFAAWYVYDATGKPVWYVVPNCPVINAGCSGALYQVTGGEPLTSVWNGTNPATQVGSITFAFSGASNGSMNFTLNGVNSSRTIIRQAF
jgi:photosystem II stability/assembly factor-like uncharacterized protein